MNHMSIPARGLLYLSLAFLSSLLSCAASWNVIEPGGSRMIEDIPFFPQEIYQCGPSSMAGIMHYWNAKDSPEAIAEEIYSKSAKGTLTMDMVIYAREKGFEVVEYEGSIPDLKENIDLGYPLIILVDYGFWVYQRNHFMVVIGYNRDGIIVNSGKEQYKVIPANTLLKTWKKTARWTLLIRPLQ